MREGWRKHHGENVEEYVDDLCLYLPGDHSNRCRGQQRKVFVHKMLLFLITATGVGQFVKQHCEIFYVFAGDGYHCKLMVEVLCVYLPDEQAHDSRTPRMMEELVRTCLHPA